jgi:hypothetical protein
MDHGHWIHTKIYIYILVWTLAIEAHSPSLLPPSLNFPWLEGGGCWSCFHSIEAGEKFLFRLYLPAHRLRTIFARPDWSVVFTLSHAHGKLSSFNATLPPSFNVKKGQQAGGKTDIFPVFCILVLGFQIFPPGVASEQVFSTSPTG